MNSMKTLVATFVYKEDSMIRDRIINVIWNAVLKDKLLTNSDLTMDKAEEIYKTAEATKLELKEMSTT
ncbi:Hypothetical protein CINCED_3A017952 [Cinara cedri]|uniref:Uncharacterized protein n=1 Tax=Cinara cedri TaxID=506608 RepID=A0A5E4NDP6_9HEMI|nr:Hypothetical protein CINCED_3A017952 [Cinara cedri]